ncbi:MAG TPA: ABC transporter substrate-binding protein [Clostridiales bacterium]|nr:ABC transporter substrate-binding protein [Clostridiales bacterium]
MKKTLLVMLALMLAFAFTGCAKDKSEDEGASPAADTINVGALFNLTGGQASLDQPSYNGFKMAADEINAAGGINGKMIEVKVVDGKTDQASVASAAKKLIDVEKAVVVAGLSDSNYALAAGGVCQSNSIPFITSGATLPTLPEQVGDYAFLAPFGDNVQAYACADYAIDDLKMTKCYLLIDQSMEFTKTLAHFFKERYEEKGGTIVLTDNYMNKDPDFSAQIDRFLADKGGAEILFISGVPDDAGVVVKQFRDKGVTLPIISGDGFDTPLLMEVAGDAANNVYVGTHASLENTDPAVQKFVADYTAVYGHAPENAFAALGYDTMYLIANALKNATDPTDPAAIRDAIGATKNLKGVTGTVTYEEGSRVPTKSVTINKVEGGKFVFQKEVFL